jgi:hypothetical protein
MAKQIITLAFSFLAICGDAFAQCSMCRATLENSADRAAAASGMNLAVLILLVPPVALFIGIFGLIYRSRN